MRSVHPAASWDDVSILSRRDISGWQSLCLTQGRLMEPVSPPPSQEHESYLVSSYLTVTACEGSLQWLAQHWAQSRAVPICSKLQDTNPICCPASTYVALTQEMWSAFSFPPLSLLVVTSIMGYDGISDNNDRNCVTLTDISLTVRGWGMIPLVSLLGLRWAFITGASPVNTGKIEM